MTTVAAIQGKGWAAIACDSRATEGTRPYTLPREVCKIVKNGPYLIGVTGELVHIPLIEYSFSPTAPQIDLTVKELDRFITQTFIPEFRDFIKETSLNLKEDEDVIIPSILVLVNGIIYNIDSTLTWLRDPSGIYVEGSGQPWAHGSLLSSTSGSVSNISIVTAKKILSDAISNAVKMDLQTGPPIHMMVQTSKMKK